MYNLKWLKKTAFGFTHVVDVVVVFFYFLFCVGASFLIIITSQYCGHLSKQEVNYMGVCLCHCVTIFFTARHYIWFTQSVSFQEN